MYKCRAGRPAGVLGFDQARERRRRSFMAPYSRLVLSLIHQSHTSQWPGAIGPCVLPTLLM